jgi:DNA-binding response OmpR family regulator
VQRLLSAGAVAFLTKPFDVKELLAIVDETLEDSAQRSQSAP